MIPGVTGSDSVYLGSVAPPKIKPTVVKQEVSVVQETPSMAPSMAPTQSITAVPVSSHYSNLNFAIKVCCCCVPLKIGSILIAVFSILFSLYNLGYASFLFVSVHYKELIVLAAMILSVTNIAFLVASIILIMGITLKRELPYKIYLVIALITVVLDIIFILILVSLTVNGFCEHEPLNEHVHFTSNFENRTTCELVVIGPAAIQVLLLPFLIYFIATIERALKHKDQI